MQYGFNYPLSQSTGPGELAEDVFLIQSTNGVNPGGFVTVPRFLFACAPPLLLQGRGAVPRSVQGFAGLGRNPIALPTQLSSYFGFQHKFALCLAGNGVTRVVFFGGGPFMMSPGLDISRSLNQTPLTINRRGEYYIGVRSIKINEKVVPLNKTLLSVDQRGNGGTMISTVVPYTILHSSIFKAVTQTFANELSSVSTVLPVAPFGLCFNRSLVGYSRIRPNVPNVNLVLQNNNMVWTIFGSYVVAPAGDNALCLAFVDGGVQSFDR
ncbi:hypothetical protein GIB67_041480 [Kingdonia uniflora]|uniref:Peptidase A1 domain-containing protein n=1 Tax=Kingdonia uniflora TaxID=39325 RepID=A0A7J7LRL0_9MAGN|nr:hypothetical protein GIB67_041480 [Kingdonia uniflora]